MTQVKKTRYLDHIDLRVTDLKRARKFYNKLPPALGFICARSSGRWEIFYAAGEDRPEHSSVSREIAIIGPTARESPFGLRAVQKLISLPGWRAKLAAKIWKAQSFVEATVAAITHFASKMRMVTNWKSAVAKIPSLAREKEP